MKKFQFIILALASYQLSFGQSELPKYAPSPDKIKVLLDMPLEGRKYKNGTGFSLNPTLLQQMPQKVALVSFYSFDPGMTKIKRWTTDNSVYSVTHTQVTKRNAVGTSGEFALGYFLQSIDVLKSKFQEYGMELLLPEEYLDTDAKKEYYDSFEVKRSKFNDWISKMGSGSHDAIYGYLDGYNVLDIVNEPYANYTQTGGMFISHKGEVSDNQVWVMDKCGEMVESLGGDLCTNLGVDAVVIVYFTIFAPKDSEVVLQNVNMHMFGPNPTPLEAGKDKKFNYFTGQFYCGTRVNPEVTIWKVNKKDPATKNLEFTGFENIMQAMITEMGSYLKEGIEKGSK